QIREAKSIFFCRVLQLPQLQLLSPSAEKVKGNQEPPIFYLTNHGYEYMRGQSKSHQVLLLPLTGGSSLATPQKATLNMHADDHHATLSLVGDEGNATTAAMATATTATT